MENKKQNIHLRSQEVEDIMGVVPPVILRWGSTILAITIFTLIIGCYFIKYPETLVGDIVIYPDSTETPNLVQQITISGEGTGKIRKGQEAQLRFINYPDQEYGYVSGIVQQLSPTPDQRGYYKVYIQLPKGLTTSYGIHLSKEITLRGKAEIVIENKRLLDKLLSRR
jgi:hypothetical protein